MNKQWICIYKTTSSFEAAAVQGNIESEGIACVMLNKQDSSYLAFGYIELHVLAENETQAKEIINSLNSNSQATSDGI